MGTAGHGHQLYVGYGEESTYGTAVARSYFLDVNSESVVDNHTIVKSGALNKVGVDTARVAAGSQAYAGDIAFDAMYGGWERLLRFLSGSTGYTYAATATSAKHTVVPADDVDDSFTLEVFRDSADFLTPDQNKAFLYDGCKINQMTFAAAVDSFLQVTASIIAKNQSRGAKSSPSLPAENLIVFTQGAVTIDGASYNVANFNLTINNSLNANKRRLGSRTIFEPTRDGKIAVTGSLTLDFESFARYDKFMAATAFQIVLTCTGGAIGGAYSGSEKLTITLPYCRLTSHSAPVGDVGQIEETFNFECFRNAAETSKEYTIDLENDNATVA